jgi:L,D-transpeptidase ErfK/SrfK
LYDVVPVGTAVHIVKQPIKVGWLNNTLYIEAHPDLEGEDMGRDQRYGLALRLIEKATKESMAEVDQKALNQALTDLDGEPVAIYERVGAYNPMAQPSPMPYSPSPTSGSQPLPSPPPVKAVQPMAPLPPPVSAPAEETQLPSDSDIIPLPAPKGGSPGGYYHGT